MKNATEAVNKNKAGKGIMPGPGEETLFSDAKNNEPREPREEKEVEHDFRMAKFTGKIMKIAEDWKNDRDYQVALLVGSSQRKGLQALDRFNGNEVMTFRVLPEQPRFDDKAPEEFGDKVPAFGVAMIERLEKKSCQGVNGWEKTTADELLERIKDKLKELRQNTNPQDIIDAANYLFFLWHNLQRLSSGAEGSRF
jgi:hypothetical protein